MKNGLLALILSVSGLYANDAYEWIITPQEMAKLVMVAGPESNIPPKVLYSIGAIESGQKHGFNAYAFNGSNRNKTADMGLMQINSSWIPTLKKHGLYNPKDIYIPQYNVRVGAWILRQCINQFGQSWKSIDCYNKGPGNARNNSEYVNRFISAYQKTPDTLFYSNEEFLASNP